MGEGRQPVVVVPLMGGVAVRESISPPGLALGDDEKQVHLNLFLRPVNK